MIAADAPNTAVSYMYRDASNYKQHTEVVFAGRLKKKELAAILANLDGGEFFIPSQVGLEDLQESFGSRLYDDDHVWHELSAEDFRGVTASPTEDFDVHEFARRMSTTEWDVDAAMKLHGLDVVQEQGAFAALPEPAREVATLCIDELQIAAENGQVDDEDGFAADVVTRLIRSHPRIAASARAAIEDVKED